MNWKIENLKPAAIAWAVTIILLFIGVSSEITQGKLGIMSAIYSISLFTYFVFYIIYRKKKN